MENEHYDASAPGGLDDQLVAIYEDISSNVRASDEISFKLLGTVPLISGIGAGTLTILEKSGLLKEYVEPAVISLSALGVLFTIGLFRWEMRNIQKCNWLISRAAKLEQKLFKDDKARIQFNGMADDETLGRDTVNDVKNSSVFEFPWGKTQAEKLIYAVAVVAWFIPMFIALVY